MSDIKHAQACPALATECHTGYHQEKLLTSDTIVLLTMEPVRRDPIPALDKQHPPGDV